jgi:E3 ubiquitin-protein ligase BRE1
MQSFQKDAILRQMKEYKREKNVLEQQLADVEKRAETFDDRLLTIDAWLQQVCRAHSLNCDLC